MTKAGWVRSAAAVAVLVVVGIGVTVTAPSHKEEWSAPWVPRVEAVDHALASRNVSAAIHAWRDANGAALRSLRWDALADVGDAAMRLERATGDTLFRAEARRAYLHALFRANAARSIQGLHRLAVAFGELGDAEVAARATEMANTATARQAGR